MLEKAKRFRLPDERQSVTHHFIVHSDVHGEVDGYVNVGMFENGMPGEIFLTCGQEGSRFRMLLDAWATAISIGLQSGIPIETFVTKFSYWNFEPKGRTSNPQIKQVSSVLDYVSKWLALKYVEGKDHEPMSELRGSNTLDDDHLR